ncbi:MAG: hypothetical protein H7Y30_12745 [Pyrinomonadaceae bacterium]|nr:hypothetical protein [Pyrinomonadaceae bacterium]
MKRITFWLITATLTFTIGVVAAILWIQSNHSKTSRIDLRGVYINQDLRWESPPKDITGEFNLNYRYTGAVILVFYPTGQFASINCTLYQADETSKIQIIPNEGFGVFKGTWMRNSDDKIMITSRLTSSNKMIEPFLTEQQKEHVEQLIIRKIGGVQLAGELELNGKTFIPSPIIEGVDELLSWPNGHL